jgi:hypothetical protein
MTQTEKRPSEIRALRPNTDALSVLTTIAREQEQVMRTLLQLSAQLGAQQGPGLVKAAAPPSAELMAQAKIMAELRASAKPLTYQELSRKTGLTKSVIYTQTRKLAYSRQLFLSLEPGPEGKLCYWCRRPEAVVTE